MRKVNIVLQGVIIPNPLPETPDATISPGLFWSAAAKPVRVNCRPPDYTARDGLHIVDGAEPWCGPARRLANPRVARTSGAPSCALSHSPVPGPGHATRYYRVQVSLSPFGLFTQETDTNLDRSRIPPSTKWGLDRGDGACV